MCERWTDSISHPLFQVAADRKFEVGVGKRFMKPEGSRYGN